MTETGGIAIFNSRENFRIGSVGKPLPSLTAAIPDENDQIVDTPSKQAERSC